MNKQNKLRSGIFAIAMVLLCNPQVFAQSGRTNAPGSATVRTNPNDKTPAATELKNFKADASNAELSDAQLKLLRAKAEFEARQRANNITSEEMAGMEMRIGTLEAKVKALQANDPRTKEMHQRDQAKREYAQQGEEVAQKKIMSDILETKQCTRAQLQSLTESQLRDMRDHMKDVTVTDLVNATPDVLKQRQENLFYIPAADWSSFDMTRQLHILNNPSTYIVVKEASEIPKAQVSRAYLNTLSPEKRQAYENSNDFIITD